MGAEVTGFYVWQWEGEGVLPVGSLFFNELSDANSGHGRLAASRRGKVLKWSLWVKGS